ncbi:MAG: hypothetical protein JST68_25575 [Bacteroidetes bacterium]|nr:hypothetical protein [Bacteroidota bacterium]
MKTTMQENQKRTIMSAGKKLFIILFSLGLAYGASAQRGHVIVRGGGYHYVPRTYVGVGVGLGYGFSPWGYPYGFYNPWGPYPYPYYNAPVPTRLALQIEDINNDYEGRINDVKDDKTLTGKERRQKVRALKHDREAEIIQAKKDYYYNSRRGNVRPNNGQEQQQGNQNQQQQPKNGSSSNEEQPEYKEQSTGTTGSATDLQQQ